jgi:hypothetical protein
MGRGGLRKQFAIRNSRFASQVVAFFYDPQFAEERCCAIRKPLRIIVLRIELCGTIEIHASDLITESLRLTAHAFLTKQRLPEPLRY